MASSNQSQLAEQRLRDRKEALERWLLQAPIAFRDLLRLRGRVRGLPNTEWGIGEWIAIVHSFREDWLTMQRPKNASPVPQLGARLFANLQGAPLERALHAR